MVLHALERGAADGAIVTNDLVYRSTSSKVAQVLRKAKLPAIFPYRQYLKEGKLISYGPDPRDVGRKLAIYVDKIFKGAKPADSPVEQLSKYELVIDLRATSRTWDYGPIGLAPARRRGDSLIGYECPLSRQLNPETELPLMADCRSSCLTPLVESNLNDQISVYLIRVSGSDWRISRITALANSVTSGIVAGCSEANPLMISPCLRLETSP